MPIDNYQKQQTQKAFTMIEDGVKSFYDSDKYKQYLSFLSRFHNYSLNNTLLILQQNPLATYVAGYQSWKKNFNRQVNKDEKGILILAPVKEKFTKDVEKLNDDGTPLLDDSGNPVIENRTFQTITFKTAKVFDVSQTSGDPLPTLNSELKGSSHEAIALMESIKALSETQITFTSKDIDPVLQRGSKGYFSPSENKIVVDQDLDDIQKAKTLVHEYAHSRLHKDTDKPRDQMEIEAESTAFVLCNHFSIDTSDYSFGYVASFADKDIKALKSILANIQDSAHEMIETIEPVFHEKLMAFEQTNDETKHDPDIEKDNYMQFEKIAKPILTGEANYLKYKADGFMDLNIERIDDDRVAISHNYVLNGDLMADPDMEIRFDNESKTIQALTYQQDNLGLYHSIETHPYLKDDLNQFLNTWFQNIQKTQYKLSVIATEKYRYSMEDSPSDLKKYAKEIGLGKMIEKKQEIER